MKFTNGYWLIKDNVQALYAAQVYDAEQSVDEQGNPVLVIYAPTRPVRSRGDVLNGSLLTIRYSSPMPDVIRVRITHFEGIQNRGPSFESANYAEAQAIIHPQVLIQGKTVAMQLVEGENTPIESAQIPPSNEGISQIDSPIAHYVSGALSISLDLSGQGWKAEVKGQDQVLTGWAAKSTGYMLVDKQSPYMVDMLRLSPGEYIYGLGERFGPFIKNGQSIDIWNEDGGTASEQAYKNVPFCISNRGYGIFVNSSDKVSFEIASEKASRLQFSVPGEVLDYYIIYGPGIKAILSKYTSLTGRPALLPPWAFGLWLTTSFTTSYDETTVQSFIEGMQKRNIPLRVFHFDCFWMREYNWVDLVWDSRTFPDPSGMLKRIKQKGLSICVWINPYVAQRSVLFPEAVREGYLLKKPNGDVWQTDMWQAGMGIIDFTNPRACRWFQEKLSHLIEMGVDSFKTDFGERIPVDVVYYDGSDPVKMHNYYTYLYNKTVFQVLEEKKGKGQAVLFARSATAGSQRFPAHWGGDCESTYEAMAETLRGGLSLSVSGFGFWSHDIGGFEGMPPADLYKRWLAFGLLSPLSRLHGSNSYRVPWLFDEEAVEVAREFTALKYRLMPYLYQKAVEAHQSGIPMLRSMFMEFPEDPTCAYLDLQYMLGDALLVAPIFSASGTVRYYVPSGCWTNWFTGEQIEGSRWIQVNCSFKEMPLLVRPNSVIPIGSVIDRPDYAYNQNVAFMVFNIEENKTVQGSIPDASGNTIASLQITRQNSVYRIITSGKLEAWSIIFVTGGSNARIISGEGTIQKGQKGLQIIPQSANIEMYLD